MSSKHSEQLVKMINQIAANTPEQGGGPDAAAEAVAAHVRRFWAKPMRADIRAYLQDGGVGLTELAVEAIKRL